MSSSSLSTSVFTTASFLPFKFVPLRTFRQQQVPSSVPTQLPPIPTEIQRILDDKEWMLEPGQHSTFPSTLIDQLANRRIFTPSDFVSIIEKAAIDDVQATAFDGKQQRKPLNAEQWIEMKKTGEVTVPSVRFQNQYHRWRLAREFYSGIKTIQESFATGIGKVVDHWFVDSPHALFGNHDKSVIGSLRHGIIRRALSTLVGALDQTLGSPLQYPKYSEYTMDTILEHAENAYTLHHLQEETLDVPPLRLPSSPDPWDALEKDTSSWNKAYRPSQAEIDRQTHAQTLVAKVRTTFDQVMKKMRAKNVKLQLNQTLLSPKAALMVLHAAELDWSKQMKAAWEDELRNNTELGTIGVVAANHLQAERIIDDREAQDANEVEVETKAYQSKLQKKHNILSLSTKWMKHKVDAFATKKKATMDASRPGRLTANLREAHLESAAREQELRNDFRTKLKDVIQKQLASHRLPCPPAIFHVPVFRPGKWHYRSKLYATSFVAMEFGHEYFWRATITWFTVIGHVQRYREVAVDVSRRFWRLNYTWNNGLSKTMWFFGGCYHSLVSGPLSLRALLSKNPFYAYKRIKSSKTAALMDVEELEDDPSSFTPTLYSRMASFYQALDQVRVSFDASPDTGLIGKNIQRKFLQAYLAFKQVVGTTIITGVMVTGSLSVTAINVVGVLAAPLLALATVMLETMFHLLIFDYPQYAAASRSPDNRLCASHFLQRHPTEPSSIGPVAKIAILVPYHVAVSACLMATWATFRGVVFHPLVGAAKLVLTTARQGLRLARDAVTWNLVIRPAAKLPASDSFLAKRVHGPGLASEYYHRIPLESAQTSVRLSLDSKRIQAFAELQQAELMEPFHQYDTMFETALKPFGIRALCTERGPASVSDSIVREWETKHLEDIPLQGIKPEYAVATDAWDYLSQRIRSANPDYAKLQSKRQQDEWDKRDILGYRSKMDQYIINSLHEPPIRNPNGSLLYQSMANRAGHLLAEIFLRQDFRDSRIRHISAIPPQSKDRFRLSTSELDQLWKFTLQQTEETLTVLQQELFQYAATSSFAEVLTSKARSIMNRFYTAAGGRPGTDVPLVAAYLLTTLFGKDTMQETLEDVDQTMVLMPKRSELDRHFDFGLFGNSKAWKDLYEY